MMHAEVMAIGDELTSGQRLDTNSQWLSARLGELGIQTAYHTTVSDELEPLGAAIKIALDRCDLLLITGGLGPTADDLTREGLARGLGVPLELNEPSLQDIQQRFASRGRAMPERNRRQAMFPRGGSPIANAHGTAPGIHLIYDRGNDTSCELFALPGVPVEMHEMWHSTVATKILGRTGSAQLIHHRRIKCFGEGESAMEQRLPGLIERGRDPLVGITVHNATITLRITTQGSSAEECESRMQPTIATIHECLGDMVFGEEEEELQDAVMRLLNEQGKTLATAECGTSGRLARWLSEIGDPAYRGGLVAAAETSHALLAQSALLAENGAISCREQFGADFAIALGPIPEPALDETGEFHYALASEDSVMLKTGSTAGHPGHLRDRAAKQALNLLRLHLLNL